MVYHSRCFHFFFVLSKESPYTGATLLYVAACMKLNAHIKAVHQSDSPPPGRKK